MRCAYFRKLLKVHFNDSVCVSFEFVSSLHKSCVSACPVAAVVKNSFLKERWDAAHRMFRELKSKLVCPERRRRGRWHHHVEKVPQVLLEKDKIRLSKCVWTYPGSLGGFVGFTSNWFRRSATILSSRFPKIFLGGKSKVASYRKTIFTNVRKYFRYVTSVSTK